MDIFSTAAVANVANDGHWFFLAELHLKEELDEDDELDEEEELDEELLDDESEEEDESDRRQFAVGGFKGK